MDLLHPVLGTNLRVYMDNLYTPIGLLADLVIYYCKTMYDTTQHVSFTQIIVYVCMQFCKQTDARSRAKNYLGHVLKKDVVLYLHFLRDVTSALSTLSLAMQRREATVADIHSILSTTEKVLHKFRTRYSVSNHLYFSKKKFLCYNNVYV